MSYSVQAGDVHLTRLMSCSIWSWNEHWGISVCGRGLCVLIEICDGSTGYNGPLDECPWAPRRLSSLLGGWLSLGGVSGAVLRLLPLFMTVSIWHQVAPPVLFSPLHWNVSRMCCKRWQPLLTEKHWVASLCFDFQGRRDPSDGKPGTIFSQIKCGRCILQLPET